MFLVCFFTFFFLVVSYSLPIFDDRVNFNSSIIFSPVFLFTQACLSYIYTGLSREL
jgi:hypothetical protein